MTEFRVRDLYLAKLCIIKSAFDFDSTNKYIIVSVNDNIATDVITRREYYIVSKTAPSVLFYEKNLHGVISYDELETHLDSFKEYLTIDEINELKNRFNGIEVKKESFISKDIILNCINETYEFIISLNLKREIKSNYIIKLKDILSNYINELKLLKNNDNNYSSNELLIRRKYLNILINLEDEIRSIQSINIDNLLEEEKKLNKKFDTF